MKGIGYLKDRIISIMQDNPIIAAVKDEVGLNQALKTTCDVIFILYGDISNIGNIVKTIKETNKIVLVNIDLIDGLASSEISVDYIMEHTEADGIISSKAFMVRFAVDKGLFSIHRFFLIDSKAYHSVDKQFSISHADMIEVMPGVMPKVIKWIKEKTDTPIIATGLVCDKEDVMTALSAGSIAISSTNSKVWDDI